MISETAQRVKTCEWPTGCTHRAKRRCGACGRELCLTHFKTQRHWISCLGPYKVRQ